MRTRRRTILGLVVVWSLVGCGLPQLTRDAAADPIAEHVNNTPASPIFVPLSSMVERFVDGNPVYRRGVDEWLFNYLVDRSYLEVEDCELRPDGGKVRLTGLSCELHATPVGRKFFDSLGCHTSAMHVMCDIARMQFLKVTDVVVNDGRAQVEFAWVWKASSFAEEFGVFNVFHSSGLYGHGSLGIGVNVGVAQFQLNNESWELTDVKLRRPFWEQRAMNSGSP